MVLTRGYVYHAVTVNPNHVSNKERYHGRKDGLTSTENSPDREMYSFMMGVIWPVYLPYHFSDTLFEKLYSENNNKLYD